MSVENACLQEWRGFFPGGKLLYVTNAREGDHTAKPETEPPRCFKNLKPRSYSVFGRLARPSIPNGNNMIETTVSQNFRLFDVRNQSKTLGTCLVAVFGLLHPGKGSHRGTLEELRDMTKACTSVSDSFTLAYEI